MHYRLASVIAVFATLTVYGSSRAQSTELAGAFAEAQRIAIDWNVATVRLEQVTGEHIAPGPAGSVRVGADLPRLFDGLGEPEARRTALVVIFLNELWLARPPAAGAGSASSPESRAALECQGHLMATFAFTLDRIRSIDASADVMKVALAKALLLRSAWPLLAEKSAYASGEPALTTTERFVTFHLGLERAFAVGMLPRPAASLETRRLLERLKPFAEDRREDTASWSRDVCERVARQDKDALANLRWKPANRTFEGSGSSRFLRYEQSVENRSERGVRVSVTALSAVYPRSEEGNFEHYVFVGTSTSLLELLPGQSKTLQGRLYLPASTTEMGLVLLADPTNKNTPVSAQYFEPPTCAEKWAFTGERFEAQLIDLTRLGYGARNGFKMFLNRSESLAEDMTAYESKLNVNGSAETKIVVNRRQGSFRVMARMHQGPDEAAALGYFRATAEAFRRYCDADIGGIEEGLAPSSGYPTFRASRFVKGASLELFFSKIDPYQFGPKETQYGVYWILHKTD